MSDLVVRPVRFTDNVEQMRRLLEALGLRPRVEAEGGGWVDMVAGGGMVALHSAENSERQAPSGFTTLSFEADDIDVAGEDGSRRPVCPRSWCTTSPMVGCSTCRDPLGHQIAVDERSSDPYGYRVHEPTGVRPGWRVMAVRFADPLGPYGGFLAALGLVARGEPDAHFTAYALDSGDHGLVGLHPPTERQLPDGSRPMTAEPGAVALSFETAEDLREVADRLAAAGFEPQIRTEVFGSVLATVDADGQDVEIHHYSADGTG